MENSTHFLIDEKPYAITESYNKFRIKGRDRDANKC